MENFQKLDINVNEVFKYLFELRESGVTNMFGAVPYMLQTFPDLTYNQAKEILFYWMQNFERLAKELNVEID